ADGGEQFLRIGWLLQDVERAALHCAHRRRHAPVAREEDDRQRLLKVAQPGLEREAAESGHPHVQDHAPRPLVVGMGEELLTGAESTSVESGRLEQTAEGPTEGRVVVHDVHHGVAHGCGHGAPRITISARSSMDPRAHRTKVRSAGAEGDACYRPRSSAEEHFAEHEAAGESRKVSRTTARGSPLWVVTRPAM